MAEQEQVQQLPEAPFPAPPPFWRQFTRANEQQLQQIETSPLEDGSREKLPIHLAYLRPPPPPPTSAEFYTTFGQKQVIDPTKPSSLPTEQLLFSPENPNLNHAAVLSSLTKSLLLNFLELTSVLYLDPTKHEEKMEDIRQLLINIHVVINIYRPHQARESVKEMLEGILEDGQREIDECDRLKEKVAEFLSDIGNHASIDIPDGSTNEQGDQWDQEAQDEKLEKQRRVWKMIQDIG